MTDIGDGETVGKTMLLVMRLKIYLFDVMLSYAISI